MEKNEFYEKKYKTVSKITFTTLFINVVLAFAKLLGGIFGFSKALISDSINSFGDIITSFITLLGGKLASKKPDKDHPFGHERVESIAILIFEMVVIVSAVFMGVEAVQTLINPGTEEISVDILSLIVAAACIGIKFGLFINAFIFYKKNGSSILKAQMLDHLLDSIGTTVSLVSIIIAKYLQVWWIDSAATLVIVVLICITAIKVMIEAISCLIDKSWTEDKLKDIENLILLYKDVKNIDFIKSRKFGDKIYLEVEVVMDKDLTLEYVHNVIEDIHIQIEQKFIEVIHVAIHVNPTE